jgi:hypothetical protein
MKRLIFGKETKLEIFANTCPDCGAQRGHFHKFGCAMESCPKCGGRLLKCSCKALDITDSLILVKAIADNITDKAEIHRALAHGSKVLNANYYEDGCMLWIIEDVTERDPELARKANETLMADMGFRKAGNGYAISAEDAAKNMGISVDEAHKVLSGLQAESQFPGWDRLSGPVQ